jgi:hypothetical protein
MAERKKGNWEEVRIVGGQLVDTVKDLVHQGNIRRIIVKDEDGKTFLELPLTVGVVGTLVAPLAAALGALAALVKGLRLEIEKVEEEDKGKKSR